VGALRDPRQVVGFIESAEQAAAPASYATFQKRQALLRRKTGVDVNSLLTLVSGNLIVESDTRTTMGRVAVSDPAAASRTLARLATQPHSVFAGATTLTPGPGGFYLIRERRKTPIQIGVVGNELVAGKAAPAQLRAFAAAPATPAAGAHGSVAFRISLPGLLTVVLKHAPSQLAQLVLSKLGDITGWTAATPSGLTGTATLSIH
jgi:hypothetical protein